MIGEWACKLIKWANQYSGKGLYCIQSKCPYCFELDEREDPEVDEDKDREVAVNLR